MKQILVIDESPLFREYLRFKLEENDIEVSIGIGAVDGASKMRSIVPDLVITDYHLSRQGIMEVLKQKKADPNTVNIPVIIMAQRIDQKQLIQLIPYNVKKVFNKPVKVDALFITLSEILGIPFTIDESPGIVEVHVTDNIVFIEIAQGLNRDKLDLLRFKITELIDFYEIRAPRVIIMLSDIKLGFGDAPNMEKLLVTVTQASKAKMRHIRVLTMDDFVKQYIKGQKEYDGIEVVSNLQYAIDDLLSGIKVEQRENKAEIIGDKLLRAKTGDDADGMALKFEAETRNAGPENLEDMKDLLQNLKIAIVDDDFIIQELIKTTFRRVGASVTAYSDGDEYLAAIDKEEFDLVFLDINMPRINGFAVLKALQLKNIKYPIIALSAVVQREIMIKAIQLGVRSYLIKPLKPDDIFKKSLEILKANF